MLPSWCCPPKATVLCCQPDASILMLLSWCCHSDICDDMYNPKNGEWNHSKFMKKCYLTIGGNGTPSISLLAEKWRMVRQQIYLKNDRHVCVKISINAQLTLTFFDILEWGQNWFVVGSARFTDGSNGRDGRDGTDGSISKSSTWQNNYKLPPICPNWTLLPYHHIA